MRRIAEDIKTKQFKNLYLLYGSEDYLKHQFRDKLIKELVNDGDNMNFSKFNKETFSDAAVIDLAETVPFFAKPVGDDGRQYRVILIEDAGLGDKKALPKKDVEAAEKSGKKIEPNVINYLSHIPEQTIFIILEKKADARKGLFAAAKECDRAVEMKMLSESDLQKWIGGKLNARGKKMKMDAFQTFLKMTHSSMYNMETELEKLMSYVGDRDEILAEDVEAICVSGIDSKVFDIINALVERDLKKAMAIYQELLVSKVSPREILGLIVSQFRLLKVVKEQTEAGYNYKTIASKMGENEYRVKMSLPAAKQISHKEIDTILKDSSDYLYMMNTGTLNEKIAVESIMLKFLLKTF